MANNGDQNTRFESDNGNRTYAFGSFRLDAAQRILFRGGEPVHIPPKSLELLAFFVANPNQVIDKETLMREVWPEAFVEEANISVHISSLRKVLGARNGESNGDSEIKIETFPKVGYRFVADVIGPSSNNVDDVEPKSLGRNATRDAPLGTSPVKLQHGRKFRLLGLAVVVGLLALISLAAWNFVIHSPAVRFSGLSVTRLTTHGGALYPEISPDGKFVVYGKDEGGKFSVWLKVVGSTSETRIAGPTPGTYFGAAFSPDGKTLHFTRSNSGATVVDSIPLFGGGSASISLPGAYRIAVAPDGDRLTYLWNDLKEGKTHLMIANIDGSDLKAISTRQAPNYYWTWTKPAWSPDGKRIACVGQFAYESTPRVLEIDVETGRERAITPQVWTTMHGVDWLPDMSGLLITAAEETTSVAQVWYISYPDGAATKITNDANHYYTMSVSSDGRTMATYQRLAPSSIWVASVDGGLVDATNATKVSSSRADGWDSSESYGSISWTPDGRLVFTSEESGNGDIWIMNSDGSGRRQLTVDRRWDTGANVSADGSKIAFMSRRLNTESIWLMDIDGGNQRRITGNLVERMPEFTPDGKWLYYNSWETGKVAVWRMPVEGGQPEQFTSEVARIKKISNDGEFILYGRAGSDIAIAKTLDGSVVQRFPFPGNNISWMPGGSAISYIRATDGTSNLWVRILDTGETRPITNFASEGVVAYDWSRDGKRIAYARGAATTDVIVMSLPD